MARIKYSFIVLVVLATLHGINCQLAAISISLSQMIPFLENTTNISPYLPQLVALLKDQKAEQSQMANSLTEIQSTQNSIASTQTQIANATNQIVSLLQRHEQQLENVTATMISMMELQNTQNQILTFLLQIQTGRLLPLSAQDCTDILDQGFNDSYGVYTIKPPDNLVSFPVSCDLKTEGGGWILLQRRFDGSIDFYRGWEDYKNGFGELDGEHWLGLEKIHRLTSNGVWQLRIELEDFYGNISYAEYNNFVIGNETTYYMFTLGAYSGTAGDSMTYHANRPFSTYDQDRDSYRDNCAQDDQGAWWYGACGFSNLNGPYVGSPIITNVGMVWWHWKDRREVLKKAEMKMRRTQ